MSEMVREKKVGSWKVFLPVGEGADGSTEEKLVEYVSLLQRWSRVHNLTAIREEDDIYQALIVPSLAMGGVLSSHRCLLDLGTGAGIPGLILAIVRPRQSWVLVEKSVKKCSFLKRVVSDLGLENVSIHSGGFAEMPFDDRVEAIVSRGSAKLSGQVDLTEQWRKRGVPLFSIQTEKSFGEYLGQGKVAAVRVTGFGQAHGLVLVKVK